MRTLLLAGLALCLAGAASGQILSVSCTPTTGPTTAGVPYSATCTASGGIAPYSWSISAGAVPAGLSQPIPSADTTTATISGTPTTAGSYSYTVEVTDSTPVIPMTATQDYSGTVAPNITSISPTTVAAGGPDLTLTVDGAGFGLDSTVFFNATQLNPPTVVSSNEVTVTIPASLTVTAGTASITLTSGGATSNTAPFTVTPTITSLSPNSATAGGPGFTLTVNGTGFESGATVSFNGTTLAATVASPTQLTASVSASLIATPGMLGVVVISGGLTSNSATFTVVPPPSISSISPTSVVAGSSAFTLTVSGSNFGGDSVVNFNGTVLTPTSITASQVMATVPANLITTSGTIPVTVTSGGVTSNSVNFTVVPAPTTSSIGPTSTPVGSAAFMLTVNGANFGGDSVVNFGGTALSTTVVSASQLTATVSAGLVASTGTVPVTVTSGGVTSNSQNFTIAGPVIISINPATVTAGGATFPLTVNGSNFVSGSVVQWTVSGATTTLLTTYLSAAQVSASVPSNLIAAPGSAQITVKTNSATSNSETLTIVAGPALSGLNPNTITAGSASFTLIANGGGFASGATVLWGSTPLPTTFQNPAELDATVPANLVASVGTVQVSVSSGGVTSNSLTFTIVAAPTISTIDPNTITAGSSAFTITVTGSGFASGATVKWNGTALGTVFDSATQLTATVLASDVASPGTAHVTVTSGGVTSNTVNFTVVAGPAITSLTPSTITAGSGAFTLTVTGTGFAAGDTILWNTTALTPTSVSAAQLTASIPASYIASPATVSVTVRSAGGVSSNSVNFTVVAGPAIASLSPSTAAAGSAAFTLTVTGTGFASGAAVLWNTTPLTTTFVSATQLKASVAASMIASPGIAQVTVKSGSITSNSLTFTIFNITSLNPSTATAGGSAFTLTVNGNDFVSGAVVEWNGTALATSFVSSTQLTAPVLANLIASSGTAQVTVVENGATSNALTFTIHAAGPTLSSLSPASIIGGSGAGLGPVGNCPANVFPVGTLTINGSGFASGATANWNGDPLVTTFVSSTQLTACVPGGFIQGYGTAAITVTSGGTTTNAVQIALTLPSISLKGLQTTSVPTQQLSVGVQLASATPTALSGTLQLSFTPNAAGVSAGYRDPALQFSSGGTTLNFTVPAGASSITAGTLQQGTVAGTITVTLTSLTANGASVLPSTAVAATVTIPPLAPVITAGSVQITNVTSSGFDVVVTGYSTSRDMKTANFTFTAAPGTQFSGTTTFAVDVSSAFSSWYASSSSQPEGSLFLLTVPFTISGPTSVLGSVSVTLTNSIGTSAPESASQ